LGQDLIAAWELSPEWVSWFDEREGRHCALCAANLRSQGLARALLMAAREMSGIEQHSLRSLCADPEFRSLSVAEINGAGGLHQFLGKLPNLSYSEYGSTTRAVRSEDLLALSYADASFDLVITSDSIEHVPHTRQALREVRRILRPDGLHVFTVPVVWDRATTRQRASLVNGKPVHHLRPSYHGKTRTGVGGDWLVFYEFGSDFVGECADAGFAVRLLRDPGNQALVTFLARAN